MELKSTNKKIIVFGVFDLLHDGHREFLHQAGEHGKIIAIVARDEVVQLFKQKKPAQNENMRLANIAALPEISHAELGDLELGVYSAIKNHQPSAICLGYDQHALADDLAARMQSGGLPQIPLIHLIAHEPERLHSSLLTDAE